MFTTSYDHDSSTIGCCYSGETQVKLEENSLETLQRNKRRGYLENEIRSFGEPRVVMLLSSYLASFRYLIFSKITSCHPIVLADSAKLEFILLTNVLCQRRNFSKHYRRARILPSLYWIRRTQSTMAHQRTQQLTVLIKHRHVQVVCKH